MRAAGEASAEPSPAGADAARLSEADTPIVSVINARAGRPSMRAAGEASAEPSPAGADAARLSEADTPILGSSTSVQEGRE
jgi:hypothetical protein